jgi:pimeloyl-ACP methyl ester carboxylesterase
VVEAGSIRLEAWRARGQRRRLAGFDIFTIEAESEGEEQFEPLLVIHGFPSSSFDYRNVLDGLRSNRRVFLLDLPGFGLSEKPDVRYSIETSADVVEAFVEDLRIERFALLTHDMGDTVGGELLARQLEGAWPIDITKRVLTNGSIYIDLAQLTDGQRLLLSLPDQKLPQGLDPASLAGALAATMSDKSERARGDLATDAEIICSDDGAALLPRTIRYIEDRRRAERRYTGAIESHPSPVGVIWGVDDPIAVKEMTDRFSSRRPDAETTLIEGIGHYPMLEGPAEFLNAALAFLESDQADPGSTRGCIGSSMATPPSS